MQATSAQQNAAASHDAIAQAAYYQWLKAGKPNGRDQEFWLTAEKSLQPTRSANASRAGSQAKIAR
jgi:hypothetical protein